MKKLLLFPFRLAWFLIKLPFKILWFILTHIEFGNSWEKPRRRRRLAVGIMFCMFSSLAFADDGAMRMTFTIQLEKDGAVAAEASVPPMPEVAVAEAKPEEPPPPPEPPAADAADPRRLVRYFCRMWKDEEYEAMWWAMTPKYRKSVSLEKFRSLFEADAEQNGGLKDENIVLDDVDEGKEYVVTVDLRFNFVRARDRRVKAVLEKTKQGYRVKASGIIPLDLNDL